MGIVKKLSDPWSSLVMDIIDISLIVRLTIYSGLWPGLGHLEELLQEMVHSEALT